MVIGKFQIPASCRAEWVSAVATPVCSSAMIWASLKFGGPAKIGGNIMKTSIKFIAPALGAAAIGAAVVLAPIASAESNPQVPYGTNPQVPDLGYYESNSGIHSAGDTTLGSLDLPF